MRLLDRLVADDVAQPIESMIRREDPAERARERFGWPAL
jgi:hypothetical protein